MIRILAVFISGWLLIAGAPAGYAAENVFAQSGKEPANSPKKEPAAAPRPAGGQIIPATPTTLDEAENAVFEIWKRLPFTVRNSMLVSKRAEVYGGYEKRPSNVFTPGEKLITYSELIGYKWEEVSPGNFRFGFTADFELLTQTGDVLGSQLGFQGLEFTSHIRNREVYLSFSMSTAGLTSGNYVMAFVIHDKVAAGTTRTELPFVIKER